MAVGAVRKHDGLRIAIIGGGPSALFVVKSLLHELGIVSPEVDSNKPVSGRAEAHPSALQLTIFESGDRLGGGMPYSNAGANVEHVTNVSGNEIPPLVTPLVEWLATLPPERLERFGIAPTNLHDYKVVPRLLFGEYLSAQFQLLIERAERSGVKTEYRLRTCVRDVADNPASEQVVLTLADGSRETFDHVVLCTGHAWPRTHEGRHPGYFDSPYPPRKLAGRFNHPIAVRGASLTALDAVRTLARSHGEFACVAPHRLRFQLREGCEKFRIVMHSREGFLPGIRFHLDDPHLSKTSLLTEAELQDHRRANDGFISLDYLFENDFKAGFRKKDPGFFELIRTMDLEEFVELMMNERERSEPFAFFKQEYDEALRSIRNEESISWKEKLAILSFAMNQPAKYFSAEDRLRLQNVLMPLISLVIAFVPQSSCEQLIALHEAGVVELVAVGAESRVDPHPEGGVVYHYAASDEEPAAAHFATFIDCVGQPHLSFDDFPFESLKSHQTVSRAKLMFRDADQAVAELKKGNRHVEQGDDGSYRLRVPGIAISDDFQIVGSDGRANERIFSMAVPLMGGFNPDYSGLDFCEFASERIVARILSGVESAS